MNKLISMIPILTGGGNLQTQREREREAGCECRLHDIEIFSLNEKE